MSTGTNSRQTAVGQASAQQHISETGVAKVRLSLAPSHPASCAPPPRVPGLGLTDRSALSRLPMDPPAGERPGKRKSLGSGWETAWSSHTAHGPSVSSPVKTEIAAPSSPVHGTAPGVEQHAWKGCLHYKALRHSGRSHCSFRNDRVQKHARLSTGDACVLPTTLKRGGHGGPFSGEEAKSWSG